jgi:hypothetical protein
MRLGDLEKWRDGHGDMAMYCRHEDMNMEDVQTWIWRRGNMETWRHGHRDMEPWTWRHEILINQSEN